MTSTTTSQAINGSPQLLTRYIVVQLVLTPPTATESANKPQVFPETGTNTLNIFCYGAPKYYTADINIVKASGYENVTANIVIYGLDISTIDAFSRLNPVNGLALFSNLVNVFAGYTIDSNGFPPLIYSGPCRLAGADYNNPSRPFRIISMLGLITQNTFAPTTNPSGTIALNDLFGSILAQDTTTQYVYQPSNVSGYAQNVIYTGSVREQIIAATEQHGYKVFFDNNVVYIAPVGQPFNSNVFELNEYTGMLGYPIIDELGISVRMRLNPSITFGQLIELQSFNKIANGQFYINGMMYTLQNRGSKFEIMLKLNNYQFNTTPA